MYFSLYPPSLGCIINIKRTNLNVLSKKRSNGGKIDTSNICIPDRPIPWLGKSTPIKRGGVKLMP
jgi:hypothetical protein